MGLPRGSDQGKRSRSRRGVHTSGSTSGATLGPPVQTTVQTTVGATLFEGAARRLAQTSQTARAVELAQEVGQLPALALLFGELPGELGAVDMGLHRFEDQALELGRLEGFDLPLDGPVDVEAVPSREDRPAGGIAAPRVCGLGRGRRWRASGGVPYRYVPDALLLVRELGKPPVLPQLADPRGCRRVRVGTSRLRGGENQGGAGHGVQLRGEPGGEGGSAPPPQPLVADPLAAVAEPAGAERGLTGYRARRRNRRRWSGPSRWP